MPATRTIRLDGIISTHKPLSGGDLTTKPLMFTGRQLSLNDATSGTGSLRAEFQDSARNTIPGFPLVAADKLFGDSAGQKAVCKYSTDVRRLVGSKVRLHFVLHDGDLRSFQFTD